MKRKIYWLTLATTMILPGIGNAAEYQGSNLDGDSFGCTAYSYDTGNYYYLTCEFSGSDIYLYFDNGGYITVSMDDEEIDDPSSISSYDYDKGNYWDIDIDL